MSIAEADRHFAYALGAERPEQAWILSDRDVWYANPFYHGEPVPHPYEDDELYYYGEGEITETDLINSAPFYFRDSDEIPY